MKRLIAIFSGGLMGIVGLLFSVCAVASYIYFLFKAANLDHWIWFAAGLIFPPIGFFGGLFAWLGLIWAPDPALVRAQTKAEILRSRGAMAMMVTVIDQCSFSEYSGVDRDVLSAIRDYSGKVAVDEYGATAQELAVTDKISVAAATAMDCRDTQTREGIRQVVTDLKKKLGDSYGK